MSIFNLFRKKTPQEKRAACKRPESIPENLWNALWVNLRCPDCGNDTFRMGPQGGCCQNVMCGNDACKSRFNLAPFDEDWCGSPFLIERIGVDQGLGTRP